VRLTFVRDLLIRSGVLGAVLWTGLIGGGALPRWAIAVGVATTLLAFGDAAWLTFRIRRMGPT
jgi:hypothetical protein